MPSPTPSIAYLRSLDAVRDRSQMVFDLVVAGKADHWDWHEDQFDNVIDFCLNIIKRDFGTDYKKIPPHCRRNHFITPNNNRIDTLLAHPQFPKDPLERAATLIDLYIVSVLLDAGAGPDWSYTESPTHGKEGWNGGRSEGLAVASYNMFLDGVFSSNKSAPLQVDSKGLEALTPEILASHMQVSDANPMAGLEGRSNLLIELGGAIAKRPDVCPDGRPGDMLRYFASQLPSGSTTLPLTLLWETLFDLLLPIWPARTTLPSHPSESLGDVWPCPSLERAIAESGKEREEGDDFVAFHKLTQWLCYSLVEGIEAEAGWTVDRGRGQTGLPEYRNGGLLMDLGLISIRPDSLSPKAYANGTDKPPVIAPSHPAVVEWRAITVITLGKIHQGICGKLGVAPDVLSLAQVLEAATWKGGREIAKARRTGGGPPIDIISDGTVF